MNQNLLKAFFIVTRHHVFFSKIYNYDDERILGENGFKDWQRLYDFDDGFATVQYRPYGRDVENTNSPGKIWRAFHDYAAPFSEWKFNLRHQPSHLPHPRWVSIGDLQDRTFPLLPEWSRHHIIREGEAFCIKNMSRLALGTAKIYQNGGYTWAYERSSIIQAPGSREGLAFLHDDTRSEIYSFAILFERAHAVIYPGGNYQIYDQAKVDERPGPLPKWGQANLSRNCLHGKVGNMPFDMPVESL